MKAYADYKSSGVEWLGEVPSHWQVVKSKNIFGQSSQRALKNDEQLTASQKYGVIPQSLFMEYENQKVVLALTGLDNFKHIDKNDFVISLRSFQGGIELCHYDGCVSPAYTVLKAKSEINNKYFSYLLKDIVYIQALNTAVIGIREGKNISYNNFGEIVIPLPPLAEQQKIAQFLDTKTAQIDALITEQNRLIELLTEQRKTVISHAVTKGLNPNATMKKSGVEWLGEVPSHWQAVKSKNIFGQSSQRALKNDEQLTASQKYGVIPQRLFMEYENQKVVLALAGVDNFKHIDKNDFVISLRSFQGGIELCHYDGCVSPAYTVLKAKSEINNNYFSYLLKDVVYIQALNTAVIGIREGKNISYNNFGEIFIPFPPLAEQNEIVAYIETQTAQIDALITEQKRLIERLKEYRTALISAAVTGKIDVQAA